MSLTMTVLAVVALSGWLVALMVWVCFRAMQSMWREQRAETQRLRASHEERQSEIRAQIDEQLIRLEGARHGAGYRSNGFGGGVGGRAYGNVARW